MNLPNKLTIARIIMIPLVILCLIPLWDSTSWKAFCSSDLSRILALVFFCVASFTDFLDGQIARRQNLVTNMGKFLDPIADKMLTLSAFIVFSALNVINPVIVVVILARELAVTGLRTLAAEQNVIIAAGMFGKLKTVVQMFTLIWLIAEPLFIPAAEKPTFFRANSLVGDVMIYLTLLITLASGIDYFLKHRHLLREHK